MLLGCQSTLFHNQNCIRNEWLNFAIYNHFFPYPSEILKSRADSLCFALRAAIFNYVYCLSNYSIFEFWKFCNLNFLRKLENSIYEVGFLFVSHRKCHKKARVVKLFLLSLLPSSCDKYCLWSAEMSNHENDARYAADIAFLRASVMLLKVGRVTIISNCIPLPFLLLRL